MANTIDVDRVKEAARRFSTGFTAGQKAVTGIAVLAVILGSVMFVKMAGKPSYQPLFTGLQASDAGSITTQLKSAKVPYQLASGGSTILVPQASVDAERLKMAGQGLPQGGVVGFSLFDKSNLFQGDSFTEQINYTRALEGELTNTISQVSGVAYTRVNIVLPQQELFSSQQASPTASVLLKLVPGAALSAGQVGGIQHLVASAVQGLKPDEGLVIIAPFLPSPLIERLRSEGFESKLEQFNGNLSRSVVELAKEWRTDRLLRHLEALLLVADKTSMYLVSGNGDVIEPDEGIAAIGSGGQYAFAAATALLRNTKLSAKHIAEQAMSIAGKICIYTNDSVTLEELD